MRHPLVEFCRDSCFFEQDLVPSRSFQFPRALCWVFSSFNILSEVDPYFTYVEYICNFMHIRIFPHTKGPLIHFKVYFSDIYFSSSGSATEACRRVLAYIHLDNAIEFRGLYLPPGLNCSNFIPPKSTSECFRFPYLRSIILMSFLSEEQIQFH